MIALRGSQTPREIYLPNGLDNDILGQRVILCCFWVRGLKMYGAPLPEMVYLKRGDDWIELGRPQNAPDITITSTGLAELVWETEPAVLARKADLIAIGSISSMSDSAVAYGDASIPVKKVRLRGEQVLKGTVENNGIEFVVARGFPTPAWWTKTPYEFHIGQSWFVFLAHHDDGFLYPLAGHNGLLVVHGQELIYDGAPYAYSRLSLTRTVEAALGSDDQATSDQATSGRWDVTRFGNQRPGSALRAADIVLEGRVESVSTRKVRAGDVRSRTGWPTLEMDVRIVQLETPVRLRGGNERREVLVDVTVHPERLIGKRVILCGQWRPKIDNYFVHSKSWGYVEAADGWSRLDGKESLSHADVKALSTR